MAARLNSLQFADLFQRKLDEAIVPMMLTNWMDKNAGQVQFTGGKNVKVPMLAVDGMGDYDRAGGTGFVQGKATITYQSFTLSQDRGRSFTLDRHDVDETNFVATMGNIMGTFQREQVVPEIDAYRISTCIAKAMAVAGDTNAVYEQNLTKLNIVKALKEAISKIRETGYNGRCIIHMTYDTKLTLEEALANQLQSVTWSVNGINTTVPSFDGCPIIATPSNYMVSAIDLQDGTTGGQEAGGFKKGSSAKDCNFVVIAENVPIAITKQDSVRTFSPDINQEADSWKSDYRRYHDCFVMKNKEKLIFANMKEAKA